MHTSELCLKKMNWHLLDEVTVSPEEGPAALTVNFDGSASTAVNGTIVDWSWDFGDDTTGSGAIVSHTYNTPGEYYASLIVTDSNGFQNLVPLLNLITVTEVVPPTPPHTHTDSNANSDAYSNTNPNADSNTYANTFTNTDTEPRRRRSDLQADGVHFWQSQHKHGRYPTRWQVDRWWHL